MVTSRILAKLNQFCDIAGDGEAAIRKCKKKEYDVIFMDISMADIDRFQTTEHIRNISQDMKRPWIIALTGKLKKKCALYIHDMRTDFFSSSFISECIMA